MIGVRRPRQVLHRDRGRQGPADRLQLRDRAAPGTYPFPGDRPHAAAQGDRLNHIGKLAFRWAYWNMLLPGTAHADPGAHVMAGKRCPRRAGATAHARPRPTRRGERAMPVKTINGREIHVDDEGFLTESPSGTRHWARRSPGTSGSSMTEDALEGRAVPARGLRGQGETATTRRVQTVGGVPTKTSSSSSPRSRPRRWPTSPDCPSPRAASDQVARRTRRTTGWMT